MFFATLYFIKVLALVKICRLKFGYKDSLCSLQGIFYSGVAFIQQPAAAGGYVILRHYVLLKYRHLTNCINVSLVIGIFYVHYREIFTVHTYSSQQQQVVTRLLRHYVSLKYRHLTICID